MSEVIKVDPRPLSHESFFSERISLGKQLRVVALDLEGIETGGRHLGENVRKIRDITTREKIPLIVSTESTYHEAKQQLGIMNLPVVALLTEFGTRIYYSNQSRELVEDKGWQEKLENREVIINGVSHTWGHGKAKGAIVAIINDLPDLNLKPPSGENNFLVKFQVSSTRADEVLKKLKIKIQGAKITYVKDPDNTNSTTFAIIPDIAGKIAALTLIENVVGESKETINFAYFEHGTSDIIANVNPQIHLQEFCSKLEESDVLKRYSIAHAYPPIQLVKPPIESLSAYLHETTDGDPNALHAGQEAGRRSRSEFLLRIAELLHLAPEGLSANGLSVLGARLVRDAATEGFMTNQWGLPQYYKYLKGLFMDAMDGYRAGKRKEKSPLGGITDLAQDRNEEWYFMLLEAIHFWDSKSSRREAMHSVKDRDNFITGLLSSEATFLPTIAAAQARMFGGLVKESNPYGGPLVRKYGAGSRPDRVIKLFGTTTIGRSNAAREMKKLKTNLLQAFTYRSEMTQLARKNLADATSFNIDSVDPLDFKNASNSQRENIAIWMVMVESLQRAHEVTVRILQEAVEGGKINQDIVNEFIKESQIQNGQYLIVDIKVLQEKWHDAFYDPKEPGNETFDFRRYAHLLPESLLELPTEPGKMFNPFFGILPPIRSVREQTRIISSDVAITDGKRYVSSTRRGRRSPAF